MILRDDETRDLVRHLFAHATALIEDAHQTSIEGQASNMSVEHYKTCAVSLLNQLREAKDIATAAMVIASNSKGSDPAM